MQVFRAADRASDPDDIAVAINEDLSHVGLVTGTSTGDTQLCDFQHDKRLVLRDVPPQYFWVRVTLAPRDAAVVGAYIRLVHQKHRSDLPYSLIYIKRALSPSGDPEQGAGFTCVTFIVNVFEALQLPLVRTETWKSRAKEDEQFKATLIGRWTQDGVDAAIIMKLYTEVIAFRIKPIEIFGAAGSPVYPVVFTKAKVLAAEAKKQIDQYKPPAVGVSST